jgi:glycosyltransferase 2 family protein
MTDCQDTDHPPCGNGNQRSVYGVLRTVGFILVIVFLAWQLWRVRHDLGDSLQSLGWNTALTAGGLAAVSGIPGYFGWRRLLPALGVRLSPSDACWVYFLARITRYVPGGVWPTLTHAALARPLGQSPARLAAVSVTSLGLSALTGLVVGVLALPRLAATDSLWWLLLPVAVAAVAPLAMPKLLGRLLAIARRFTRHESRVELPPRRRAMIAIVALMTAGWLIGGVHVAVLAIALGAEPGAAITVGIGGFALSVVAGLASVVMPAGIGAREVVLGLAFSALLTGSDLVTLVGMSRVLTTVGDVGVTAVVLGVLAFIRRPRIRQGAMHRSEGVSS